MITLVTASLARSQASATCARSRRAPRDLGQHVEDREPLFLVHRREIELRAPRGFVAALAREFAGEKSAGKRAPDQEPEPLILDQRNRLALELASSQRIVRLRAPEALEMLLPRHRQRLHQLPGGQIRAADVAHLAGAHEIVERAQRVFDVRQRVGAVNLIEVDVVGAEPLQARFDRLDDVQARQADVVRTLTHASADFRREHDAMPPSLQRLPTIVSDSPTE